VIIRTLLSSLQELARERSWGRVLFGSDHYVAWVERHPLVRVSPDVFIVDDPPEGPLPRSWQTWLPGHRPPRFAVEIVSDQWRKDYDDAPAKYGQMGCCELVVFDPDAARGTARDPRRAALVVYRRAEDAAFVEVYRGDGPAFGGQIGAWIRVERQFDRVSLRLSHEAEARAKAEARVRELEQRLAALDEKNRG